MRKTVLASGAFDLVHYGHIRFLEEAKKAGGKQAHLIVVVARDATVQKLKGTMPIIPEDQRRAVVESLKPVDEAVLGYPDMSLAETIQTLQPNIIAVGYDQKTIERQVQQIINGNQLSITIARIGRFKPGDLDSSSKIKRKIMRQK
ncbi:MAG: FAD synthase [Candidatus Bathyarchaeota archaeon]|nr:MAG: FAD synthase [Candidatus Bathyarchaeota archaeon]